MTSVRRSGPRKHMVTLAPGTESPRSSPPRIEDRDLASAVVSDVEVPSSSNAISFRAPAAGEEGKILAAANGAVGPYRVAEDAVCIGLGQVRRRHRQH